MHIKQVIICGFRSYRDQVIVDPFSRQHNVVIGRNGTGKSNFFDAIQFGLLTSKFANLRQEDRQALLHEGSGKHIMSAYVEIIFDNADGRLPVDTEEVVLRRTIGVKKDEFFLNRKHISKGDVIHLLETAGFSRSNPYYIVQQGKVNKLVLMKDKDRLELLKEVAGTCVYEERRQESLKILHETQTKREKIEEVNRYIEERLAELEEEKDELREYQQLDRQKRALEYTMHDKELQKGRIELEELERSRVEEASQSNRLHDAAIQTREEIRQLEDEVALEATLVKSLQDEKEKIESERHELMKSKCSLELDVNELREYVNGDKNKVVALKHELKMVQTKINQAQQTLEKDILPRFTQSQSDVETTEKELSECQGQSDALISKQSRKSQFSSQKERDEFLIHEIAALDALAQRKVLETTDLQGAIAKLDRKVKLAKKDMMEQDQEMLERRDALDAFTKKLTELKESRNVWSEERKEKWRAENQMVAEVDVLTERFERGQHALYSTMAADVRRGLQTIQEMKVSGKFAGIHGPLIELVEPEDDRFCTALDEAAGASLFHVVVDSDDTASSIMKELEKKKLGRVTFLPLNRLKALEPSELEGLYPQGSDDVMPLMNKLKYDKRIEKAVACSFGKKLLCRDLRTCVQYAETTEMDCLTLDGDMVHRRGALNGGYKDPKRSRTKAMMEVNAAKKALDEIRGRAEKTKAEAQLTDQKVTSVLGEIQKLEMERKRAKDTLEQRRKDLAQGKKTIVSDEQNLQAKEELLQAAFKEQTDVAGKIASLRLELGTTMQDTLTELETQTLRSLSARISDLRTTLQIQRAAVEAIRGEKKALENLLHTNLLRRREEISIQLEGGGTLTAEGASDRVDELNEKEMDWQQAIKLVTQNTEYLQQIESKLVQSTCGIENKTKKLEALKTLDVEYAEEIQRATDTAEKILNQRNRLLQKREDTMRGIRDLGTLPMSELEQYKTRTLSQVIKLLHACNESLQEYNHVNKKALDQYISFSEQRSLLLERKKELDHGFESISQLIDVLDQRKDEAILRTFKGVSHHFSEVFQELVPSGSGKMLIVRRSNDSSRAMEREGKEDVEINQEEDHNEEDGNDEDDNEQQQQQKQQKRDGVDTFAGIQIKVNFRGEGDSYLMQQLSGGQKCLVALAFIFAIQRCDPAPFYLFDEIDQALDSTHRAAVSALIHRQAHSEENPAQFITSTFRPEMVSVADKCYGIAHQNKISDVHPLPKDDALGFIADIMAEEESVAMENIKTVVDRKKDENQGGEQRSSVDDDKNSNHNKRSRRDSRGGTTAAAASASAAP